MASIIPPEIKTSLAREFPNAAMLDVSPDGKNIALMELGASPSIPPLLRVIEIGSWRTIYSTGKFQTTPAYAAFFAEGQSVLVQTSADLGNRKVGNQVTVIDLQTGERAERVFAREDTYYLSTLVAVSRGAVLVTSKDQGVHVSLSLVEFPSYREIAKAPYAIGPREPPRDPHLTNDYGVGISDDRKVFAYSYDHTLVCRRTEDLKILWTRQIEPTVIAWSVVVSPNGSHVAAAIADDLLLWRQREYYVSVYDGKTGADVARLPLSGTEGMALSSSGKFLAVVNQRQEREGGQAYALPTAQIHEVPSGKRAASLVLNRIKVDGRIFLNKGCKLRITSDNQYLISFNLGTKIWKLGI